MQQSVFHIVIVALQRWHGDNGIHPFEGVAAALGWKA
jgi:hypothetical protein